MSSADIFSALSIVVSGLAALLAAYYSRRSLRFSAKAEMYSKNAIENASQANVISANAWLEQYMSNVRIWADEACDAIAVAVHSLKADQESKEAMLVDALSKLSSLIDRGRWFFPNLWSDEYGQHKEPAYRGVRQPILDALVNAYNLIDKLRQSGGELHVQELIHYQRSFVSEVQKTLNPQRRNEEMNRIKRQFDIAERLRNIE